MNCLVTGGAGFIGSNLVRRLLAEGHDVKILDNFSTGLRTNLEDISADVEIIEGDLRSYERVHRAVKGAEIVFHQAALPSVPRSVQDPLTSNAVNVTGTLNVLLAARDEDVRRVIFASSSSVYGDAADLPKVETAKPMPISPYANSKLAAEHYCQVFKGIYELDTISLRYFNVFGPRQNPFSQYASVVPRFILAAMDGKRSVIFGDGYQSRDFTFIDNVVEANLLAAEAETHEHSVINVATGTSETLHDLIAAISRALDVQVEVEHEPRRPGDVLHSLADIGLARATLGYEPKVDFEHGVTRTAQWFTERA